MPCKNVLHIYNFESHFRNKILISLLQIVNLSLCLCLSDDIWEKVPCNEYYQPYNCDFDKIPLITVDDFYRCGPANLNVSARQYFLGAAGERITYNENKKAYKRLRIIPKYLRGVSRTSLAVNTLGQKVAFPVGLSPVAFQKLADPEGEKATLQAISDMGIVMILSSFATITIEEAAQYRGSSHLWMQTDVHSDRSLTANLVTRAERSGFEAIVVTIDLPVTGTLTCNGRQMDALDKQEITNFPGIVFTEDIFDKSATFSVITWIRSITNLPVVAKGVLTVPDARMALQAGASAILVSNHGGRQIDSVPATIQVLSEIAYEVHKLSPHTDVYVDGGIRTGQDVYKAIAMGAKMVFIGRPIIWGLAKAGESGVNKVLSILKGEFEETMIISGAANPSRITRDRVKPAAAYF